MCYMPSGHPCMYCMLSYLRRTLAGPKLEITMIVLILLGPLGPGHAPARPAEAHDLIVHGFREAHPNKGRQPIGPKVRLRHPPAKLMMVIAPSCCCRCRRCRPSTPKHLIDTQHPAGIVHEAESRLSLEAIDVGDVGQHHVPLIDHHAAREESEQHGLDDEADQIQYVSGLVQAVSPCQPSVAQAADESADDQR